MTSPSKGADGPDRVEFKYTQSDGYRVIHGSGAYGGLNGQHNISFDIYTEQQSPPSVEEKKITAEDELVPISTPEDQEKVSVQRVRQVGIVMTLSEAKTFVGWLEGKIEEAEETIQELQELQKKER